METEKILQDFKEGKITLEEAADFFKMEPYTDLGYAKIDNHRKIRQGYSEIIFCQGKNNEHLLEIFGKYIKMRALLWEPGLQRNRRSLLSAGILWQNMMRFRA